MIKKDIKIKDARILNLGVTFKENCPDIRNSKAIDVIQNLEEYGARVVTYDPWADQNEVNNEYKIHHLNSLNEIVGKFDAIILTVAHEEFLGIDFSTYLNEKGLVYDVKGMLPKQKIDKRL